MKLFFYINFLCFRYRTTTCDGRNITQSSLSNPVSRTWEGNHHEEIGGNPVYSTLHGSFRNTVFWYQQNWAVDQCWLLKTESTKVSFFHFVWEHKFFDAHQNVKKCFYSQIYPRLRYFPYQNLSQWGSSMDLLFNPLNVLSIQQQDCSHPVPSRIRHSTRTVSYTHLTLPTIYSV